jgi:hypothetical protein
MNWLKKIGDALRRDKVRRECEHRRDGTPVMRRDSA